jgi:hypothetical protein
MKQLQIFGSLAAEQSVGWLRDDARLVHVFAQAKPGERVMPSDGCGGEHWPCQVCDHHGYTEEDFWSQLAQLVNEANSE